MKKLQEIREFLSFLYIKMALCMFIYKFVSIKRVKYTAQNIFSLMNWIFCMKSYDSLWYTAPVAARRLLLIIMINIMKPCQYEMFGGLFKGNIEGFSKVINSNIIKCFEITPRRDVIEQYRPVFLNFFWIMENNRLLRKLLKIYINIFILLIRDLIFSRIKKFK